MKRNLCIIGISFVLLFLFPIYQQVVYAEDTSEENDYFVDLDGDGFNDNTHDFENDEFGNLSRIEQNDDSKSDKKSEGYISFDFGKNTDASVYLTKSEKFSLLKSSTRDLQGCRGESDTNFGGNSTGMGGSGQSGGCAGGSCVAN